MASQYKCLCGETQREGQHPFDCETCRICGSKIVAEGEEYDTPLEHAVVERTTDGGFTYKECKRCGNKL